MIPSVFEKSGTFFCAFFDNIKLQLHTQKWTRNFINLKKIRIVITLLRLIWQQTKFRMCQLNRKGVIAIIILFDSTRACNLFSCFLIYFLTYFPLILIHSPPSPSSIMCHIPPFMHAIREPDAGLIYYVYYIHVGKEYISHICRYIMEYIFHICRYIMEYISYE